MPDTWKAKISPEDVGWIDVPEVHLAARSLEMFERNKESQGECQTCSCEEFISSFLKKKVNGVDVDHIQICSLV